METIQCDKRDGTLKKTRKRLVRPHRQSQENTETSRLFECIRARTMKGSPEGYNAETGLAEPAQEHQTGEPHERQPLYRIRRTQEKHQLLLEDRRWADRRGRQDAGDAGRAAAVGAGTRGALARRDGSDAVQRLDLRCLEAFRRGTADGTPGHDESHRRVQEEERQAGRPEDSGLGALRLTPSMLRGAAGNPRVTRHATLPQPGGEPGDPHEEQDERAVDGSGRGVQQAAATRKEVLHAVTGHRGRSAGIGERHAAAEPGRDGDVRDDAAAIAGQAAEGPAPGQARGPADQHSGRGRSDGAHVGAGGGRPATTYFRVSCRELLWTYFGVGLFGRQGPTGSDFEAAQRALTNGADRSGEDGPSVESAIGRGPRARAGARESQPGHPRRGAETGGVLAGRGQIWTAVPDSQPASRRDDGGESGLGKCSALTIGCCEFSSRAAKKSGNAVVGRLGRRTHSTRNGEAPRRFASDPPAVSRLVRDCHREACLLMGHTVCFEAGRFTQTQSSATAPSCSRKWMSGPADAWTEFATDRRRQTAAQVFEPIAALQEPLPKSAGEVLFSLDKPLSWMSHKADSPGNVSSVPVRPPPGTRRRRQVYGSGVSSD